MVDVKICCKIWGISLVSMAIKDRPAGSVLCSLRNRMRDEKQLLFQIIFPAASQGSLRRALRSSFCLNTFPVYADHLSVTMQLKAWESSSERKHWKQLSHRSPFSKTIESVSEGFYSCPLSDMQKLHFDQGTSDPTRYHHNCFSEGS